MAEKMEMARKVAVVCELLDEEEEEEKVAFDREEAEDSALRCLVEEERAGQPGERRWYVRPLNTTRPEEGEWGLLVEQMRRIDEERHFSNFRMSAARFDDLVRHIEPLLQHAPTHTVACPYPLQRDSLSRW